MAKKTVIAVTEIHQEIAPGKNKTADSPAVPPKTRVIKPGTRFSVETTKAKDAERSEYDELFANGAIRAVGDADAAPEDLTDEDDQNGTTTAPARAETAKEKREREKRESEEAAKAEADAAAGNGGTDGGLV